MFKNSLFLSLFAVSSGVNECSSYPCKGGGKCVDLFYGFRCICLKGFEGKTCERGRDSRLTSLRNTPVQNVA